MADTIGHHKQVQSSIGLLSSQQLPQYHSITGVWGGGGEEGVKNAGAFVLGQLSVYTNYWKYIVHVHVRTPCRSMQHFSSDCVTRKC